MNLDLKEIGETTSASGGGSHQPEVFLGVKPEEEFKAIASWIGRRLTVADPVQDRPTHPRPIADSPFSPPKPPAAESAEQGIDTSLHSIVRKPVLPPRPVEAVSSERTVQVQPPIVRKPVPSRKFEGTTETSSMLQPLGVASGLQLTKLAAEPVRSASTDGADAPELVHPTTQAPKPVANRSEWANRRWQELTPTGVRSGLRNTTSASRSALTQAQQLGVGRLSTLAEPVEIDGRAIYKKTPQEASRTTVWSDIHGNPNAHQNDSMNLVDRSAIFPTADPAPKTPRSAPDLQVLDAKGQDAQYRRADFIYREHVDAQLDKQTSALSPIGERRQAAGQAVLEQFGVSSPAEVTEASLQRQANATFTEPNIGRDDVSSNYEGGRNGRTADKAFTDGLAAVRDGLLDPREAYEKYNVSSDQETEFLKRARNQ